ncbi:MAG: class I SAM-dependent methyltransferase [Betaproteobacteria bacterium]|nr:class I SAM-dependent methyltransferase [Betaproteobacteria bacterium]
MNTHELSSLPVEVRLPAAARTFYAIMQRLDCGVLTFTSPEGFTTQFRGRHDGPHADLRFADWGVAVEALKSAEIGLAECYRDHRLSTSDLTAFLSLCLANQRALESVFYGKPLVALLFRIKHFLRSNTREQARKNISAHYDLSNDFYRLWLDQTMSYSSGLFAGNTAMTMLEAQIAKYERVLQILQPQPGQSILELGCGWGGFAEYAAMTRGVNITGITLSTEQLGFARERIANAGLVGQVDLQLVDYRDVLGRYDFVVSIEMFEAVGERYWPTFFRTVHARLKPGGRALVQTITIAEQAFERYRATSDFIREYIFPGGMLVPIPRFVAGAERAGLSAGEPFRFGLDYAETVRRWLASVNRQTGAIKTMGFDDQFLQLWRFYLCYCEAAFRAGRTDVMQIELRRDA